jgi:amino acid transporter
MKEPSRILPRALFLTLGLTALVYVLVVWIAVTAVLPHELARSSAPLALVFERLTGLPLVTLSAIAVVATAIGVGAILVLALAVPLAGLADLTARCTLAIFAIVNLALIRIKSRNEAAPLGTFICPRWVPFAGLLSSLLLLVVDVIV